jgi:predicted nucleic acid-binding protein
MPVKVFNETFGRDEEKVFGENTNRSFGEIEVPSTSEFQELAANVGRLRRELAENRKLLEVESQEREALSARSLDREHAERVMAELKESLADTSVFTNAMQAALHAHEKRLRAVTELARREVETLHHQAHASAVAAQASLETYRHEAAANAQKLSIKLTELKVMLEVSQQMNNEIRPQAEEIAGLRQLQAWSVQINQRGFWGRLEWLFRGNTDAEGADRPK